MIALASEYDRLTPEQQRKVTMLVIDDGTWTNEEVEDFIDLHFGVTELTIHPEDWAKR